MGRLGGALLGLMLIAAGCNAERSRPTGSQGGPPPSGDSATGSADDATTDDPMAVCSDGESRACKITLDPQGEVNTCFLGEQNCVEGQWSSCMASALDPSAGTKSSSLDGDGWSTLSLSTAQDCANNDCDPSCQVYGESPPGGAGPAPSCSASETAGGSISALPGGFSNKILKDFTNPPSFSGCSSAADCQADHYCDTTICQGSECGQCIPWGEGEYDATATLPNFTQRTPCDDNVIVCNRGGVAAPAGAKVAVIAGNSSHLQNNLGSCGNIGGQVKGTCTVSSSIDPGECVTVPGCPKLNGTKGLVVNTSQAINNPIPETECADNWAVFSQSANSCQSAPTPSEGGEPYAGNCPKGTIPQWGQLTYSADVPAGASIEILLQSSNAPSFPNCDDCAVIADIPATHPESCTLGGPSPCPISLYDALGGMPAVHHENLEVRWRLTPNANCEAPTLDSWEITYSCVDAE